MGIVSKIHGLWRFDGYSDPVLVSRRSFLFMGGVVAAGAALPGTAEEFFPEYDARTGGLTGRWRTARGIILEREAAMNRQLAGLWPGIPHHWSPDSPVWMGLRRPGAR